MILQALQYGSTPHDDFGDIYSSGEDQQQKQQQEQQQQQQLDPQAAAKFAQLRFMGLRLCSGCVHQLHQLTQQQQQQQQQQGAASTAASSSSVKSHKVYKGLSNTSSSSSVPFQACLQPAVGFSHLLWSSLIADAPHHYKSIADPFGVEQAGVHRIAELSQYWPGALQETQLAGEFPASLNSKLQETGFDKEKDDLKMVRVPHTIGLLLRDRVHDIEAGDATFAAYMLRQLVQHLQQVVDNAAAAADEALVQSDVDDNLPPYPASSDAVQCTACEGRELWVDYTVCNLFGRQLQQRVGAAVRDAAKAGAFNVWFAADEKFASLYGGHEFKKWVAPK
jgi:hypothetical protein